MINFGIIGAGWIGGIHADRLAHCDGARLAVVHDADRDRARRLAEAHGVGAADSVEAALAACDAAIIATSTASHRDVGLACVEARRPFLVEKPVAADLASARELADAAERAGVPASVGLNRRFDRRYGKIRAAVAGGALGRIESLRVVARTSSAPSAEFLKSSGGLFGDFGIHFFDLAHWILDQDPVEVTAMGSVMIDPAYRAIGHVDTAGVIVRFASGALFHLDIGWRAAYGHDERLEVSGSEGVATAGDPPIATPVDAADPVDPRPRLPDWFERFEPTYLTELQAFVAAIRDGSRPAPTLADGVVAQALVQAASDALRLGRPVALDTLLPASPWRKADA